jgi:hypothetical protein
MRVNSEGRFTLGVDARTAAGFDERVAFFRAAGAAGGCGAGFFLAAETGGRDAF